LNKKHADKAVTEPQAEEKNGQLEEMKNKYLRALADLDNYKKRANLEKEEIAKFANETIIRELLPVLDGFAKAIEFAERSNTNDLKKGIALLKKLIEDAFAKFGVAAVGSICKHYDPHVHEAMFMKESDGEAGIVLEEAQKGYTLHGRLIRPAMVIVSKKKEEGK
jgi:molecular chaperone GrpE